MKNLTSDFLYDIIFKGDDVCLDDMHVQSTRYESELYLIRKKVIRRYKSVSSFNSLLRQRFKNSIKYVEDVLNYDVLATFPSSDLFLEVRDIPNFQKTTPLSVAFKEYVISVLDNKTVSRINHPNAVYNQLELEYKISLLVEIYFSPKSSWISDLNVSFYYIEETLISDFDIDGLLYRLMITSGTVSIYKSLKGNT